MADSVELSIPKPHLSFNSLTPYLLGILVVAAFFIGSLYTKVQYLEKNSKQVLGTTGNQGTGQQQQAAAPPAATRQDINNWAKAIGLNFDQFNNCYNSDKYKNQIDKDTQDGRTAGVSGTPSFFINGSLIVGAQPFAPFKDAIDKALKGEQISGAPVKVENGHLPIAGSTNASVTVIEFSDFECPFCRKFWKETYGQIKKEYVDTGKIAFYYRHFPLEFHPMAQPFALASECANEQGKFWEMHDKIFSSQAPV